MKKNSSEKTSDTCFTTEAESKEDKNMIEHEDSETDLISEPEHISGVMLPGGGPIPLTVTCISTLGKYRVALSCEAYSIPDYEVFFEMLERNLI